MVSVKIPRLIVLNLQTKITCYLLLGKDKYWYFDFKEILLLVQCLVLFESSLTAPKDPFTD